MSRQRPTEFQAKMLCRMVGDALVEIRILNWQNNSEQAADLADAFHNLPYYLHSDIFDWDICRRFLVNYEVKYPYCGEPEMQFLIKKALRKTLFRRLKLFLGLKNNSYPRCSMRKYVEMFDKIRAGEEV
jgi:hypothetical protein